VLFQPQGQIEIGLFNRIAEAGLKLLGDGYLVRDKLENPDAILVRSEKIDTDKYPNLIAIARAGAGVNTITVDKATARGICVFNTPGANSNAVAELVMTMIGAQMRNLFEAAQFVRTNLHFDLPRIEAFIEANKKKFVGRELFGQTLGVIGLGHIGVRVANLGVQKGMKVIGFDAYLTLENAHQLNKDVQLATSMEVILEEADVITVHVPLTETTRNLIGATQIDRMKRRPMLVNYSRRGIYDEKALFEAFESDKVASYISDFPNPELLHPKVIFTPHVGASTEESEEKCAEMAVLQLKAFLESGTVTNSVNFPPTELVAGQNVHTRLVVVNRDVPNMIATITGALGEKNINITGIINHSNEQIGYNLIDVASEVSPEILSDIENIVDVLNVRPIVMKK